MPISPRLILFTRVPELGKVKTRLAQDTGDEKALRVHEFLLEKTLYAIRVSGFESEVHCPELPEGKIPGGLEFPQLQVEGDLGKKMSHAIENAFDNGEEAVILIGSDCPEITGEILQKAGGALLEFDLVLGPAKDGGYYLIGMKNSYPSLFQDIPWSSNQVFNLTFQAANKLKLKISLLPVLTDIDTVQDLETWENNKGIRI